MMQLRLSKLRRHRARLVHTAGTSCLVFGLTLAPAVSVKAVQREASGQEPNRGGQESRSIGGPGTVSDKGNGSDRQSIPKDAKAATSINAFTGMGVVSADHYQPLNRHQRWEFYLNQNFTSVGSYFGPVVGSAIDQMGGQPPEWGGGAAGYGRRLVSRLGTGIIQGTVQSAGTLVLGQDPRYIRSGADSSVLRRIGHGFLFTLITHNNEGKKRPALATLGAYYASSMLATYWYPDRFTALGDGVRDGNRQVIFSAVLNQFQEFWPEIRRHLFRRGR
jgi:hypothetical protein